MDKRKKIIVKHGAGREIAKVLGCDFTMVSKSLNYAPRTEGLLGRKIRKVAKEQYGGVEIAY